MFGRKRKEEQEAPGESKNPFYNMPKEEKSHMRRICLIGAIVGFGAMAFYLIIWLLGI